MKQAKIQLTADTRGFKKQIDDAKAMLKTIGDANISTVAGDKLKKIYGVQLGGALKQLNKEIKNTQKTLETMSNASSKSFDAAKIVTYTNKLDGLLKKAKEVKAIQEQIASGKAPEMPDAGGGGGGGGGRGMFGGAGRILAGVAGGMGIMSSMSKRDSMADQRLRVKGLSTDGASVGEKSALGFSPEERRTRAAEIAGATSASGAQLTDLTNSGEQMERAFGISGESFAGSIGAARKAGIGDQGKFVKNVVGAGRGAGLEGPQVGEYLQSITGYMAEMSKGVNIDGDSLNGFASAMSTLPFFKKDSARTMETLKGMEAGFKGSDEFQKAQTFRVLDSLVPGASAASYDMRREMDLFGGLNANDKDDQKTLAGLKEQGYSDKDLKVLTLSAGEIIEETFRQILKDTAGRSVPDQAREFGKRTGMTERAALEVFSQRKDGKIDLAGMEEKVRAGQKDLPIESRLRQTHSGGDAAAKDVNALKEQTLEGIAEKIADPINRLTMSIDQLIQTLGGDTSSLASTAGAVGVAGATAVGGFATAKMLAPKATTAATTAVKKGASKILPGLASGASKAAPWVGKGMKGIPYLGQAIGAAWPEDSGPAEGSLDWKIENGMPLTEDERKQTQGGPSGGSMPSDNMPSMGSTQSAQSQAPAVSGMPSFDPDLNENTSALRELTQSLRSPKGSSSRSPYPEGASVISNGRTRK